VDGTVIRSDWTVADWSVTYARRGWSVFPCGPRGKLPLTANGFKDATADPYHVALWWAQHPQANVGFIPGSAGYIVIDVDGAEGDQAAQQLGLLSEPTLEVVTGRGRHRYYRHPGGTIGNAPLVAHVDVRADRGYVLLPPSLHPGGHRYRWSGKITDVVELPPNVLTLLRQRRDVRVPQHDLGGDDVGLRLTDGLRNTTLASIAGSLRRRGCSPEQIRRMLAPLNADAVPPLTEPDLAGIARSIGRYAPAATTTPASGWGERTREPAW